MARIAVPVGAASTVMDLVRTEQSQRISLDKLPDSTPRQCTDVKDSISMRAPDAVQEHIWQKVHLRPEASVPRQPFHPVSPTSLPDEAVHEPPSFGGRFGNSLVWACFITVV